MGEVFFGGGGRRHTSKILLVFDCMLVTSSRDKIMYIALKLWNILTRKICVFPMIHSFLPPVSVVVPFLTLLPVYMHVSLF